MSTYIEQPDGSFIKQDIVQAADLDKAISGLQKEIDDANSGILDYQNRISVLQGQIDMATQKIAAIIATKTAPVVP